VDLGKAQTVTDATIMRAADLARRQQQEIPLPDVVMECGNGEEMKEKVVVLRELDRATIYNE
jgi:hypothetical protein